MGEPEIVEKTALDRVHEDDRQFRAAFERAAVGIAHIALDGSLIWFNESLCNILCASPVDLIDTKFYDRTHPDDVAADLALLASARAGSLTSSTREKRYILPDGSHIWLNVIVSFVHEKSDFAPFLMAIFEDITEQKHGDEQRATLAAVVASSLDAILSIDVAGTITSWNRSAQRLYGYTAEEALGKPVAILVPHEREGDELRILDRIRTGETVEHYETLRRRKDGTNIDISLTVSPIRDDHGAIIGASKIARDITERKLAEAALQSSEAQFRDLAENIAQLAWMSDGNGQAFWYNRRWFEYTGIPMDAMLSLGIQHVLHPDHVDRVRDRISLNVKTGEAWEDTFPLRSRAGSYRRFLSRAFPIRDKDSEIVRWFGTSTDVEDLLQVLEQNKQLNARLRRAMADTHDRIGNNLQMISALAELQIDAGRTEAHDSPLAQIMIHVRALAELHRLLTREAEVTGSGETINARGILNVLRPVMHSFLGTARNIRTSAADVRLTHTVASSLSILLMELLYLLGRSGSNGIEVTLTLKHRVCSLVIDGLTDIPGLGAEMYESAALGIEIVKQVAEWDLGGTLSVEAAHPNGARVVVSFPAPASE